MPRFIITETLVNYFVVEADDEDKAFDKVSYRNPTVMKPKNIDVIGYDVVDEKSIESYSLLESLIGEEAL